MFSKKNEPPQSRPPASIILRCSFCSQSQHQVKKLIAGPNVQICDECVDICLDVLNEEKKGLTRLSAVDGDVEAAQRAWPLSETLLFCGLCKIPTTLSQSLAVPDRGIICAGCADACEAALAERSEVT